MDGRCDCAWVSGGDRVLVSEPHGLGEECGGGEGEESG